ncbi:hypothetical protein [Candidatus Frankia alpina]|uniref:hypothetical protein n=1 Tax=Candidatus Frankia alpina TaxID=2699483 RepID=UPI001F2A3212|nr:hypothetical protein [Candidatus Frankia alpina]
MSGTWLNSAVNPESAGVPAASRQVRSTCSSRPAAPQRTTWQETTGAVVSTTAAAGSSAVTIATPRPAATAMPGKVTR